MARKKKRSKRLNQIIQNSDYFEEAVELYTDHLRKKMDWKNLEQKMVEYKKSGWDDEKVRKIFEWERKACELYNIALEKAMNSIKKFSEEINEKQLSEIRLWINQSTHSQEVWKKNVITIQDSPQLIKAKVIHLVFISKSPVSVNLGDLIQNK